MLFVAQSKRILQSSLTGFKKLKGLRQRLLRKLSACWEVGRGHPGRQGRMPEAGGVKYTPRAFKDPQVYQDMKAEMTLDKQEITEEN